MNQETPKPTKVSVLQRREALLRELPELIGSQWADAVCAEELQNRGSIQGGWPGTLPEARSRVSQTLGQRLSVQRWQPLTTEELAAAAATAYDRARRGWLEAGKQLGPQALRRAARASKPAL